MQDKHLKQAKGKLGLVKECKYRNLVIASNTTATVECFITDKAHYRDCPAMVQSSEASILSCEVEIAPILVSYNSGHKPLSLILGELQPVVIESSFFEEDAKEMRKEERGCFEDFIDKMEFSESDHSTAQTDEIKTFLTSWKDIIYMGDRDIRYSDAFYEQYTL